MWQWEISKTLNTNKIGLFPILIGYLIYKKYFTTYIIEILQKEKEEEHC